MQGIGQYRLQHNTVLLVIGCLAIGVSLLVTAQTLQSDITKRAATDNSKPLVLLAEENSPPLSYLENGVVKGRTSDLIAALGRVLGRNTQIELMDLNAAQQKVLQGEADGVFMSVGEERKQLYDFTDAIFTSQFGVFVRAGDVRIRELSDLDGKKLGVTQAGYSRQFFSGHPEVTLVLIQNYEDGFHRLANGDLDAIATSTWLAAYSIQQHHWGNFALAGPPFASVPEGIAVKKGNVELLRELNGAVRALKADGTISRIEERWRPQEMLFVSRERAGRYAALIAGGFLTALVIAMTLWVVTLKRQMRIRQHKEEQIRMLAGALQGASDCIAVTDVSDRFVYVNEAFLRTYEYGENEILGKDPTVLLLGVNNDGRAFEEILRATRDGWRGELWNVSKTGRVFPISLATSPIRDENGEVVGYVGVARDITEERRAQDALRVSEEKFSLAFKQSPSPMVIIAMNSMKFVDVNDSFLEIYGFSRDEAIGRNAVELGMWGNLEERSKILNQMETMRRVRNEEITLVTRSGERHKVLLHADVLHVGSETWWLVTAEDITAERAARDALRQSELKYRDLFENANDAIFTTTISGKITSINKKGELLCGLSDEQARGMNAAELFDEASAAEYRLIAARLQWRQRVHTFEATLKNRIGSTATVLELDLRMIFEDGIAAGIEAVGRDVTDRRQLEAQFRQVQKMEALGTLAGGVAHDFNNLLTVIKGYSVLARDGIDDTVRVGEALEEIGHAADRGAGLTSQLLAFARQHVPKQAAIQIDDSIRGMEKMLARVLGEDVKMNLKLGSEGATILLDPTHFDQVLLNLAVNARDAMPNGGSLEFRSERIILAADGQLDLPLKAGEYAVIDAADTGCGIDKTNLSRIFEPFFTTKPAGKGTGLGLSTVYGIMKQNGGHVTVTSEVGRGTAFKLYFPLNGARSEPQLPEVARARATGNETVMLVDDDAALRHLSAKVLENIGYRVLCAAGIEEAERQLYEFGGDIHLLVTDVVMPGGSGELLVEKLGKLRPTTGVLFMSGYSDGRIPEKYLIGKHPAFLAKPFTPAQLAEKVREMLDTVRD